MAPTILSDTERVAWLRLIRTENVGPQTFRQLVARTGTAAAALDALPVLGRRLGTAPRIASQAEAEDEIAALARLGGRLIATVEAEYPPLLRHISGPPPLLSMIGATGLDLNRTVAVVGARNASAAGQKMTRLLAGDLGVAGYVIVSGLARGIDAAAHRASLRTGTVAALAGGMDCIYPEENIPLARAIVEQGGLLVSEMPMGWQPRARDFPRRNRLVSGMSLGVVVVEAAKRSGSLITARMALEQDREVFAVPGSPLDPRAEGGNALIQDGARLITGAHDIIETLGSGRLPFSPPQPETDMPGMFEDAEPSEDDRASLLAALSFTPVPVDELIVNTGLSASATQMLLLGLDLEGRIEWASGQLVALRP
ncbi:MAG TPA: DNA-processing protein DprA [Devosia sp.]|nr:DNA-processing protein DprA [Devosia sp.]